jgi:ABC-type uncharacterized transport system substrate-binding protein
MANVTDPVALGLVVSLARPGGNITGLINLAPELGGKRLELLKEVVSKLARVAVLGDPSSPSYAPGWRETEIAARSLAVQVQPLEVRARNPDLEAVVNNNIPALNIPKLAQTPPEGFDQGRIRGRRARR